MPKQKNKPAPRRFRSAVRDAVTGRFLPKKAAKSRPKSTVTERIRLGRRGSGKKRK